MDILYMGIYLGVLLLLIIVAILGFVVGQQGAQLATLKQNYAKILTDSQPNAGELLAHCRTAGYNTTSGVFVDLCSNSTIPDAFLLIYGNLTNTTTQEIAVNQTYLWNANQTTYIGINWKMFDTGTNATKHNSTV